MDYKKLLKNEIESIGLNAKITKLPEKMRATPDDLINLEKNIAMDIRENETMLSKSSILAGRCTLM